MEKSYLNNGWTKTLFITTILISLGLLVFLFQFLYSLFISREIQFLSLILIVPSIFPLIGLNAMIKGRYTEMRSFYNVTGWIYLILSIITLITVIIMYIAYVLTGTEILAIISIFVLFPCVIGIILMISPKNAFLIKKNEFRELVESISSQEELADYIILQEKTLRPFKLYSKNEFVFEIIADKLKNPNLIQRILEMNINIHLNTYILDRIEDADFKNKLLLDKNIFSFYKS